MPILSDKDFEKHGFESIKSKSVNIYKKSIGNTVFEVWYSSEMLNIKIHVWANQDRTGDKLTRPIVNHIKVLNKNDFDFLITRIIGFS